VGTPFVNGVHGGDGGHGTRSTRSGFGFWYAALNCWNCRSFPRSKRRTRRPAYGSVISFDRGGGRR